MVRLSRALAVMISLAAASLVAVASVAAADAGVTIAGFAFDPGTVTVSVGDTVTWTNRDRASHTATADDGSFDAGGIATDQAKSITFSTAGTFAYHCNVHPDMKGRVVVQVASASGSNPPATDAEPLRPGTGPWNPSLVVIFLGAAFATGAALGRRARLGGRR